MNLILGGRKVGKMISFLSWKKKKRERENLSDYQSVMHSMRHGKNIARGLFYLILSLSACLMNDRH